MMLLAIIREQVSFFLSENLENLCPRIATLSTKDLLSSAQWYYSQSSPMNMYNKLWKILKNYIFFEILCIFANFYIFFEFEIFLYIFKIYYIIIFLYFLNFQKDFLKKLELGQN